MKLPPALSWMHLFPRDVSYQCDASVPVWMRELIGTAKPHSGRRIVQVGTSCPVEGDAFAGINSSVSDEQLLQAGFTHVRRFAVLPDAQRARWFVPLDSPAVSCAGFSLYSPARFSARMKVLAAKIATHLRLPIWYRDHIVIAQHAAGPIERKLGDLFPDTNFRIALSSGAPEPARNRRERLSKAHWFVRGWAKPPAAHPADRFATSGASRCAAGGRRPYCFRSRVAGVAIAAIGAGPTCRGTAPASRSFLAAAFAGSQMNHRSRRQTPARARRCRDRRAPATPLPHPP